MLWSSSERGFNGDCGTIKARWELDYKISMTIECLRSDSDFVPKEKNKLTVRYGDDYLIMIMDL